jgi:hypothetical protein
MVGEGVATPFIVVTHVPRLEEETLVDRYDEVVGPSVTVESAIAAGQIATTVANAAMPKASFLIFASRNRPRGRFFCTLALDLAGLNAGWGFLAC